MVVEPDAARARHRYCSDAAWLSIRFLLCAANCDWNRDILPLTPSIGNSLQLVDRFMNLLVERRQRQRRVKADRTSQQW